METRAAKKRRLIEEENKRNIGGGRDRLSDLPDDIAHRLLSFLPTKSVARTSVLSKRWRYLWACFPILNFSQVYDPWITDIIATEDIISAVLSRRHENSNIKFFGFKGYLKAQWLHDWIPWLVKHKVEELVLHILSGTGMLDFPRPLLQCDSLRSFTLEGKCPFLRFYVKATSGLPNLHTLSLTGVEFSDDDLFSDSSFPFLEKLTIDDCVGIIHLKICCLKVKDLQIYRIRRMNSLDISGMSLETLKINNCFKDMRVNESCVNVFAPNLQSFCWVGSNFAVKFLIQSFPILRTAQINYHFPFTRIKTQCAVNLFSAFSQVQNLSLYHQIFKILSNIYFELGGLPCSFENLKTLYISTSLSKSDIPGIACLFKSSPVVHKLEIRIYSSRGPDSEKWDNYLFNGRYTEEQFWEAQAQTLNPLLCHLEVVKIWVPSRDIDHERAINMVRFLLEHGKNLQEMIIAPEYPQAYCVPGWKNKIIVVIEGLPRGSANVKISLLAIYLKSGDQFWEAQAQSLSPFLCHLKVVKIQNLKDMKHEGVINIARFLLEHGRDLQEMIFVLQKYKDYYIPVDITAAWTKDDIGIIEGLPQGSTNVKFSYLIAN